MCACSQHLKATPGQSAAAAAKAAADKAAAAAKAQQEADDAQLAAALAANLDGAYTPPRIERDKAMPDYWEKSIACRSPDGFAAIALDRSGRDCGTCTALEKLLDTEAAKLKQSGADRGGTTHDRLKLACAWRLENPRCCGESTWAACRR